MEALVEGDQEWLNPLWQGTELCVQGRSECNAGGHVEAWVWRNLAMVTVRLLKKLPSPQFVDLAIKTHRWAADLIGDAESYEALAALYQSTKRDRDVVLTGQEAISRGAVSADLLNGMGLVLHNHQRWDMARAVFRASILLMPDDATAAMNAVYLSRRCADWSALDGLVPKMVANAEADFVRLNGTNYAANEKGQFVGTSAHPWIMLYFPMSQVVKRQVAQMYAYTQRLASWQRVPAIAGMEAAVTREAAALLTSTGAGTTVWRGKGAERLRVGFISADFRLKATLYLCAHLFQYVDRRELEVFIYSTQPDNEVKSDWRRALEKGGEHFVDLAGMEEGATLERIRDDKLHVLVDMDGYSNEGLRLASVFSNRLAPVQMAYFVYIGSLGSHTVDYIITDPVASPPSSSIGHLEKFLHMPASFFPNDHAQLFPAPHYGLRGVDTPAVRRALGVPEGHFLFASFNKHMKIEPELWAVWMRVLVRVPRSVLWLLHFPKDSTPYLLAEAAKHGVEKRILFSGFVETAEENFQRLAAADLVLDTTVYGAHTGAVDALYAGKGLLTCRGPRCSTPVWGLRNYSAEGGHLAHVGADCMASRIGASMIAKLGPELEEALVVHSLAEYEEQAVKIATHPEYFADINARVLEGRARQGGLFDTKAYAQRLVRGIRQAWEVFLSGEPARHIYSM